HGIVIDAQLNAAVAQRPRFGFWGPRRNYLILGLPMLIAMTPAQWRTVLAHELGHLRARHNAFTSWIYRVQQTWQTLAGPFRATGRLRWLVMGWFVRWYGAYFSTRTLALRRLHEYAADRCSAEACGATQTAEMLLALA